MFRDGDILTPHAHILSKINKADPRAAEAVLGIADKLDKLALERRKTPLLPEKGMITSLRNAWRSVCNELAQMSQTPQIFDVNALYQRVPYMAGPYRLMDVSDNVITAMSHYVRRNPSLIKTAGLNANDLQNLRLPKSEATWFSQPSAS